MVIFSAGFSFAQQVVVQVPATCRVVVPGLGGSAGPGGRVGDGGVVTMSDPFSFDAFTAAPAAGVTIGTWSLLGDLSFKNVATPLYGQAITTWVNNPAYIQSYNKTFRTSEGASPSQDFWGRSKGKVKLTYSATCGGAITFEVFKIYAPIGSPPSNIPRIIDNTSCLKINTQYTFSVDQIASDNANDAIGFDSYYWSGLPTGSTIDYYSADFSSITFTTGATIPLSSDLKCCFGRANPTYDGGVSNSVANGTTIQPHNTCVTINLKPAAVAPAIISTTLTGGNLFPTNSYNCLPTSQNSFTVNYTPLAGSTYTWAIINGVGWNLTTTASSITVTGIDNNPGSIKLTVNNGCTPVDFIYQINRSFVAPSIAISPANACLLAGSTTTFVTNGLGNGTNWALTSLVNNVPVPVTGATFTASTVGSSTSLFIPSTTPVSVYTLTANGNATGTYVTCGGSISTPIYIKPLAPSTPSGATCVVRNGGSAQTYTCSTVTGATGYQWSFPSGWTTGNATVTTATPTVTITPNGNTATGTISVVALGANISCSSASSLPLTINYSVIAPAVTEKPSCYNVNMSSLITVNVTNAPSPFFGGYTVSLTPTGTTTPNYATGTVIFNNSVTPNTISFNTTDTLANLIPGTIVSPPPGVYDLKITFDTQAAGGLCASTATTTIQITIPPANTASLLTNYAPATNGTDNYIVINAPTGSTYI